MTGADISKSDFAGANPQAEPAVLDAGERDTPEDAEDGEDTSTHVEVFRDIFRDMFRVSLASFVLKTIRILHPQRDSNPRTTFTRTSSTP